MGKATQASAEALSVPPFEREQGPVLALRRAQSLGPSGWELHFTQDGVSVGAGSG